MSRSKKLSLLFVASLTLVSVGIIFLARFNKESKPAQIKQAEVQAETAKPASESHGVPNSADAKVEPAQTRIKLPRSTASERPSALSEKEGESADDKGEGELVLRRNGKEVRIEQDHDRRPGVRTDQPAEAMQAYVQKRLPKGEKELLTERYFTALE